MRTLTFSPTLSLGLSLAFCLLAPALGADEAKQPVIIDTDIGSDVDDAFALALALASPELEVRAITTVGPAGADRAWIVCRLLTHTNRGDITVAYGRDPQPETPAIDWQIQYRRHPAVVWNRTSKPAAEPAEDVIYEKLKADRGRITIIALGPLTNIARLLEKHPDCKPWINRIIVRCGSVRFDDKAAAEPNIKADIKAAQMVFASGVPLTVVPLEAVSGLALGEALRKRLFNAHQTLTFQVHALYELWDKPTPALRDALAVTMANEGEFAKFRDLHLMINDDGVTHAGKSHPTFRVALAPDNDAFLDWCVDRISNAGEPYLPKPPGNPSKIIPTGAMPYRIHVVEDYETDIEKRWWMTGKPETDDIAEDSPGRHPVATGGRAFRATLTQDFDDKMGDRAAMYRAVVFNPVPGPPMGPNTRLSFRYRIKGTDTLRVQIYTLSKGYHRCLSLKGLEQDKWKHATVDMTAARRPDGSGGPLSEDERIDDIQFYIDPRAELLIDDIMLYDAAPDGEKTPFPKRVIFTGWFDTGKQGAEWPGDFEIVPHEKPLTWDAAKSVVNDKTGAPWLRIHMRGRRPLGPNVHLRFRHHLTGADLIGIALHNSKTGEKVEHILENVKQRAWSESALALIERGGQKQALKEADELHFILPKGATLLVDDVLLYEPGDDSP